MTLKDLEYFVTIARSGSITRAAAQLFIAQPALSQCLHKIEHELNVKLFIRASNGVRLTSEGECFLLFATRVLQQKDILGRCLQDISDADRGEIRLGFTGTQATHVLPHILPDFQKQHPNISIILTESFSDEIERKLLSGELDLGILHLPILHEDLDYFEISRDDMVIVPRSSSAYRDFIFTQGSRRCLHLDFLKTESLIMTLPGQRSRMVCDQILASAGITPRILQTSRNISTLDALAQVDYASAIMPFKQVSPALKNRGVFFIDEAFAVPYTFVVATLRSAYFPAAVSLMKKELLQKQFTF